MPQLEFLTYPLHSQLFWLFFSFGLLYFFAKKVILPRIRSIECERETIISNALAEANQIKEEASNANQISNGKLQEAKAKAEEIINATLAKLKNQEVAALENAKKDIELEIANLARDLEQYKNTMQAEFSNIVVDLSKHILEKNFGIVASSEEILKYAGTKNENV